MVSALLYSTAWRSSPSFSHSVPHSAAQCSGFCPRSPFVDQRALCSLVFASSSFKKSWGCGLERRTKEQAAYEVLREEYRKLGPFSFAEVNVLLCFLLLVGLWFSRDPGFMPGWLSLAWAEGETK